jgi:hypothetical protein
MLEQVMEKMSKIIKIIEQLNQNEPNSIGFGSNNNIKQNQHMVLISYVDIDIDYDIKILNHSDAIVIKNWTKNHSLNTLKKSDIIIGLEVYDNINSNIKLLEKENFDFVVFASDNVNANLLLSDKFSSAYFISSLISDDKGASIEEIGFDFLILKNDSISFPLKISDLLKLEEMVLKNSGNLIMYSNSLPSYSDLELMRKANISGIAVDGNGISKKQIQNLQNEIRKLEPLKINNNSSDTPFLPNFSNNQDFDEYDE